MKSKYVKNVTRLAHNTQSMKKLESRDHRQPLNCNLANFLTEESVRKVDFRREFDIWLIAESGEG